MFKFEAYIFHHFSHYATTIFATGRGLDKNFIACVFWALHKKNGEFAYFVFRSLTHASLIITTLLMLNSKTFPQTFQYLIIQLSQSWIHTKDPTYSNTEISLTNKLFSHFTLNPFLPMYFERPALKPIHSFTSSFTTSPLYLRDERFCSIQRMTLIFFLIDASILFSQKSMDSLNRISIT